MAFLPKGYFPTGNLFCFYQDGKDFSLSIRESTIQGGNEIIKNISVASLNQNLHDNVGVVFPLTEYAPNSKYGYYIIDAVPPPSPNFYSTTSIITGEIKITYHNYNQAILSGTFWFDAINSAGETVQIRSGRFDMHY